MEKPVIICIDDEVTVIDSLKIELKRAIGDRCIVETAEGGEDAIALVEELLQEGTEVAVVLSDYIMPDIRGDEVLKRIHTLSPDTLTILLTGQADLEAIGNAIKYAKLYRYIAKPWRSDDLKLTVVEALHSYLQTKKLMEQNLKLQQLNRELERLTEEQSRIIAERTAALEQANRELQRLANSDGLTQLANRRRFDEYLEQEWYSGAREQQMLSLILCDIDAFKQYNDSYGHLQGDDCLKQVARTIQDVLQRPADLAARYGGEEFAVILPNTPVCGAIAVAETIRRALESLAIPHESSPIAARVTISAGVAATIPVHSLSPLVLIHAADAALYEAKHQGRDRAIVAGNVLELSV